MSETLCACGCGKPLGPKHRRGLRGACYNRWIRQGRPEGGPRPALSPADSGSRGGKAAREARLSAVPDEAELAWARELWARREAAAAEERVRNVRPVAAALVRCVGAGDAAGIRVLLERLRDWPALAVVLAECADPARTAVVTCQPFGPLVAAARRAPVSAGDPGLERSQIATVALSALQEGDADAAA